MKTELGLGKKPPGGVIYR